MEVVGSCESEERKRARTDVQRVEGVRTAEKQLGRSR